MNDILVYLVLKGPRSPGMDLVLHYWISPKPITSRKAPGWDGWPQAPLRTTETVF